MIDALFVDEQIILATTAPVRSVTAVMNLATLHKTALTRLLPQEHHTIIPWTVAGLTPATLITLHGNYS